MRQQIKANLHTPRELEKLYRSNKPQFKREFTALYPELNGDPAADVWHERLNFESEDINWGTSAELMFVLVGSMLAGTIAKLPAYINIDEEFFYSRNIGFVIFPVLSAYFAWRNKLSISKIAIVTGATLAGLLFINFLPDDKTSDTLVLSCMHMVLFLWSVLGFVFIGGTSNVSGKRLGYLKYNGDLVVMTTLILIAGAILSGITVGLFSLIGLRIEEFYFKYVVVFGLAAAPIIGTYLTQTNPTLVGKVSPVIAKLFSPLVLVMLVIYLGAIFYSGKDPYNDRDFLMIFNALLIGVMAIIFFSVAENSKTTKSQTTTWILFLLSLVTIIVNGVALSAILFRIAEWGITPNRAAVLGANILILINLALVTTQLFKVATNKAELSVVGKTIASYLPIYFIWTIIVTFIFPFLFGFK
ncbi:MAG TPA: hypothetical protein VGB44_09120 [Flavobacterium sp.]